jgi:hypothetical protein
VDNSRGISAHSHGVIPCREKERRETPSPSGSLASRVLCLGSAERARPRLVRVRPADNLHGAPGRPADPNGTSRSPPRADRWLNGLPRGSTPRRPEAARRGRRESRSCWGLSRLPFLPAGSPPRRRNTPFGVLHSLYPRSSGRGRWFTWPLATTASIIILGTSASASQESHAHGARAGVLATVAGGERGKPAAPRFPPASALGSPWFAGWWSCRAECVPYMTHSSRPIDSWGASHLDRFHGFRQMNSPKRCARFVSADELSGPRACGTPGGCSRGRPQRRLRRRRRARMAARARSCPPTTTRNTSIAGCQRTSPSLTM